MVLSDSEKSAFLKLARDSVEADLLGLKPVEAPTAGVFGQSGGAFVTIKINDNLRGCIGRMSSPDPLGLTIHDMALAAAFEDPRFPPLRPDELPLIKFEISLLSPLQAVEDLSQIEVGRHGLYVTRGYYSGVLLPQVPVEWGWDREEFILQTLRKAGLGPDSLEAPDTHWQSFEAIVLDEG
jgi:AmmeMemoRadiSam system protein A